MDVSIQTFGSVETRRFFETGKCSKRTPWQSLKKVTARKLDMLHYAVKLDDLRSPPGNRLELLHGNWQGYYSIRINDQWRVMFQWTTVGPKEVQIVDYHR